MPPGDRGASRLDGDRERELDLREVRVVVGRLGHRFVRRGRPRGSVIVGTPAGERHGLATAILADLRKGEFDVLVGINLLTKIQAPTLPSLYGAMLAGVDAVLMGAGIPREIPKVLDRLAGNEVFRSVRISIDVDPF